MGSECEGVCICKILKNQTLIIFINSCLKITFETGTLVSVYVLMVQEVINTYLHMHP